MSKRSESEMRPKKPEPLAKRAGWERKLRHQSRVEKLKARPAVRERTFA